MELVRRLEPFFLGRTQRGGGGIGPIDSTENVGDTWGVHSEDPGTGHEPENYVLTADGSGGSLWSPAPSGTGTFAEEIAGLALTKSLLGYWRLGEPSGTFADSSGQASPADGTLTAGSTGMTRGATGGLPAAQDDGAVTLNESTGSGSDYIATSSGGDGARFNLPSSDMSIVALVKPSSSASSFDGTVVGNITNMGGWALLVEWAPRTPIFVRTQSGGSGGATLIGPPIATADWTLLIATYSATNGHRLYYNGVLVAVDPSSVGGLPTLNADPKIGTSTQYADFYGGLDEISVWGDELSPNDIGVLMGAWGRVELSDFLNVRTISTSTAGVLTDQIVLASATLTYTLPDAATVIGQTITVKNIGSGTVTVASSQNIDGSATDPTLAAEESMCVASDGSNWQIVWDANRSGGGGGSPTGSAGGALDGSYPNPGLASSVAGSGLSESSDVLAVNVDNSTIEINSDSLRVKDAGVTEAKLGFSDVTTADATSSQHGLLPKLSGSSTDVLLGTGAFGSVPGASSGSFGAWFGDGSDGAATFNGSNTYTSFSSLSGSVYSLTRDTFLASATLSSGVQIKTNGFRLFCSGTFTGTDGTSIIQHNGTAASGTNGSVQGGVLSNSNGSLHGFTSGFVFGTAGGAGNTGAGSNGTNSATSVWNTARGGAGGTGSGGAGGAAGTIQTAATTMGGIRFVGLYAASFLTPNANAGAYGQSGGTGGGGGGGDATNKGGGGGSGGGLCFVFVKTFAGTGAIQARGGDGGSPTAGNCGGGGGGGGGFVLVVSASTSSGAISGWTIDANGGAKGNKNGTGVDGVVGSNGVAVVLPA